MSKIPSFADFLNEDLRNWFGKGKEGGVGGGGWDRYNTKGERIGKCGDADDRGGDGEGKPKCLSTQKANQLRAQGGKQAIANAVKRKKEADPVTDRPGTGNTPKMVSNRIKEENEPTNPSLWSKAKSMARSKFDVYPSAYANGWAAKWYKDHGGGWRTKKNEQVQTSTPADREWGTDSLVAIYKHDTPGETHEAWEKNPNCQQCKHKLSPAELKRGDRVCAACVKQNKGRVWGKDSDDDYEEQMDLVPMRSVNEHIVKVKGGYRLVSKKTGKNLGTYPTKAGAAKRERQVQYFKHHEDTSMSLPSFKQFVVEQPETIEVKPAVPGQLVSEVTPPGMEDWVKKNKARFRKQYGDRGDEVLYATAWDMYEKGKREAVNEGTIMPDDDTSMVMAQLSSIIERATALKSMIVPGQLPAWVQSKMTEAESAVLCVHDYIKYKE